MAKELAGVDGTGAHFACALHDVTNPEAYGGFVCFTASTCGRSASGKGRRSGLEISPCWAAFWA